MNHALRRWQPLLSLFIILVLALTLTPKHTAQAEGGWPAEVSDVSGRNVYGLPSGTYVGCHAGSDDAVDSVVFDASGQRRMTTPHFNGNLRLMSCNHARPVVAEDGTVFVEQYSQDTQVGMMALRDHVELWPRPLDVRPLCEGYGYLDAEAYTQFGLYLHVRRQYGSCLATGQDLLLRVNKSTGAVEQTIRMPGFLVGHMIPYYRGIIVMGYEYNRNLAYVENSGSVIAVPRESEPGLTASLPEIGYEGTRFAYHRSTYRSSACDDEYPVRKVSAYSPTGKLWDFTLPECTQSAQLTATPNGGVVVNYQLGRLQGGHHELLALGATGRPLWSSPYRLPMHVSRFQVLADNNGTLVVVWHYSRQSPGGSSYPATALRFLNLANRAQVAEWRSESLAPNEYRQLTIGIGSIGLSNGRMYVRFDNKLHMIPVAGLGLDYPRARALGQMSVPIQQRVYAALGDSMSSGEGLPPFAAGTDTAGPPENRCHRSTRAYPQLLGEDPALNLSTPLFVACSGATTWNVINGQWNEGPQLQAVGLLTGVVTISIGANDVRFREFATACFWGNCDVTSAAYADSDRLLETELQRKLGEVYRAVLARAPNAQVYVVGYPFVTPPRGTVRLPYRCDDWLTENESEAARLIVLGLKHKTLLAISEIGSPRLHYIDATLPGSPFIGREVCNGSSYPKGGPFFHDVDYINQGYSFHPNQLGVPAYAELIRKAMLGGS